MPALSPSMETGKIITWDKKEGDRVELGDTLAQVQTDKTTLSYDSNEEGYLARILVPEESDDLPIGSPIAIIVENKEDIAKFKDYVPEAESGSESTPKKSVESAPKKDDGAQKKSDSKEPKDEKRVDKEEHGVRAGESQQPKASSGQSQNQSQSQSQQTQKPSGKFAASPLARKIAGESNVSLDQLSGTGPNGRIIAADVREFSPSKQTTRAQGSKDSGLPSVSDYIDTPNSKIRNITAERLTHSKQNIPHYYLTVDVNVDKLLEMRTQLNTMGKGDYKLSVNDFVIKAAAIALRQVPELNSEWRGDSIRQYKNIHINVAVNTPKGLLTPIVRDADKIGLRGINSTVKEVGTRAQEGKSKLEDLEMGTFTISNLGMFGINQFSAVINPPQAGILAVGASRKAVVLDDKQGALESNPGFKVANMMNVTLSCDHRVVDGAIGAKWLQVFQDTIENPVKALL